MKSLLSEDVMITRIVLDKFKFDMDTFNKEVVAKLREHRNSPIKIFVNCKNSRRKLTEAQKTNQMHLEEIKKSLGDSLMLD